MQSWKGIYLTANWLISDPSSSCSFNFKIAGFLQNSPFKVSTSGVRVALIRNVCTPLGIAAWRPWISSSYPYDSTRSASSTTKWDSCSRDRAELLMFIIARDGVEITISGRSARIDRWTESETFWMRLMERTSFAQYAESDTTTLCTCSASSLVGTRTRAEVDFRDGSFCLFRQLDGHVQPGMQSLGRLVLQLSFEESTAV